MNTYFYSHCAGSVIAMKLLDRLNQSGSHFVQGYMAGASIPPRKALSGVNIWKHMSNKRIAKALNKAGLGLDTADIHLLDNRLDNFRSQTLLFTEYFHNKKEKTDICITPIVSRKDPLTPDYKNAQKRWLEVANDINEVFYLDTPSHYFQTTDAEFLLKIFSNI